MKLAQLAALAAAFFIATSAGAQTSNSLAAPGEMLNRISAKDVSAMMTDLGVTTELKTLADGGAPFVIATTPGGGRFLFRFFSCDIVAESSNCAYTIVTTALPSAGVTYDDLNDFNRTSMVTTGINVGESQIVVLARNIVVYGGHSRELFKDTVYLFLTDVQKFLDSKKTASSSVAFAPPPEKASKITGFAGSETATKRAVNAFGVADYSPDVAAAIVNTNDIDFSVDYKASQ